MSNTVLTQKEADLVMDHLGARGIKFEVGPALCIKRQKIGNSYEYSWGPTNDPEATIGPVFYDLEHEQKTHEVFNAINWERL